MPPNKREKKGSDEPGAPGWMVTYGDMMSLLLCFFVLLLSFSTISEKDFKDALTSMRKALGVMPKNVAAIQISPIPRPQARRIERSARELRRRLQLRGRERDVELEYDGEGGLKISLPSQLLFDSASDAIKPEAYPVLQDVAQVLGELTGVFFEIRGHTDDRPLVTARQFRDNLDLSFARADAVARYINRVGAINLDNFEVIACGAGQPKATNATEDGRQANRRVEIFVRGEISDEQLADLRERGNGESAAGGNSAESAALGPVSAQ